MTENDLVEMKLDGTIISGKNDPSSEWKMHAVLYSQNEDIRAIVHTHSQYATAFAILGMPIPLILIEMVYSLGKCVPLAEFALPGTEDLGHKACKALEEGVSCLLANHGVLAVGDNVSEAYERVHYVEHVADIYHKSLAIGSPNVLSEQMAAQLK
jgi:ribulose-5-phosphate 4-epimerase/fuculose-1-phosphate aldolase